MGKCNAKWIGLAVAAVLVLCPAGASAAETETPTACPCCEAAPEWVDVNSSTENPFSHAGHYRLTEDIYLEGEFVSEGFLLTVDLNGCSIYAPEGCRAFFVGDGAVLNILDRSEEALGAVVGNNKAVDAGGVLYVDANAVVNLYSGRLVGTSLPANGGTVYIRSGGTMNIYGGAVVGGTTNAEKKHGGNIYNAGTLNMYGGTVTGGTTAGYASYGGNIYNNGTFDLYDGTIEDGASHHYGGNLFVGNNASANIYGGIIQNGTSPQATKEDGIVYAGNGANIYVTGTDSRLRIYGGIISGGEIEGKLNYGGNLMINSGAHVYMYGGTIEGGVAKTGGNICVGSSKTLSDGTVQYSSIFILGGTITGAANDSTDVYKRGTNNVIAMYNCRYNGIKDVTAYRSECACYIKDDAGYTFWHKGDCTDCVFAQAVENKLVTEVINGRHNYQCSSESTYTCQNCQDIYYGENVAAALDGVLYEDLTAALAAVKEGSELQLFADATVSEAAVAGCTLDLNGYTLTADSFTSAVSGDVIDSSPDNAGKLVCDDVTLAENNTYVPLTLADGLHFCRLDFTQWVEPVDENTTKVKFYFTQRSAETVVDDAVKDGNRELDVQISLSWVDSSGNKQTKTVSLGMELLKKYVARWDSRVFVATVKGTGISALTCTWQVTSKASSGTTLSSESVLSSGYIHENLSWEQINSFPLKRSDMTEEEMRQEIVDFMYFTKTYLWTPSVSVYYDRNTKGTDDKMLQGTVYGGLPYVGVASGNVYRMMDYINEYGILDMEKALPSLATKDQLAMSDLKYFGSQCSISVYWGWGRLINSANYLWTYNCVPSRGFILLGDMQIEDIDKWTAAYNTTKACHDNGEQVMYGNYAAAKKADGLVYYIQTSGGDGAGHLMMVYEDAHVVYNADGTINGDESYLVIIDQGQSWKKLTNDAGDSFSHKGNIGLKKTFKDMYDYGYVAFTFPELVGLDPIEETTVSLVSGEQTLIEGVISEADRSYNTTVSAQALTWSELMESAVTSNYGIADIYVMLYDDSGEEIYKHAVRTGTAGNKNLSFEEDGAMVTVWGTKPADSTYTAKLEVQLATGERPVIYDGQLTMDN